jgi:hypothetical protein
MEISWDNLGWLNLLLDFMTEFAKQNAEYIIQVSFFCSMVLSIDQHGLAVRLTMNDRISVLLDYTWIALLN